MIGGMAALMAERGDGKVLSVKGVVLQGLMLSIPRILGTLAFFAVQHFVGVTYVWGES